VKTITLTQGKVALVDDEDYERILAAGKWYAHRSGKVWYAERKITRADGRQRDERMHWAVLGIRRRLDHKDGNGLNCQKTNLRFASYSQNGMNQARHRNNKSGVHGVFWNAEKQKWQAQIKAAGKKRHLGYFALLADAAEARRHAELLYFKDFSTTLSRTVENPTEPC
jgi:hypothetical protein